MKLFKLFTVMLLVFAISATATFAAEKGSHQQTTCPVMGGKINQDIYADYEGKRVYFCCDACISPFKKDPAKYISKLEGEGVVLKTVPSGDAHHDHEHDQGKKPSTEK